MRLESEGAPTRLGGNYSDTPHIPRNEGMGKGEKYSRLFSAENLALRRLLKADQPLGPHWGTGASGPSPPIFPQLIIISINIFLFIFISQTIHVRKRLIFFINYQKYTMSLNV